jgi:hypothetical protein
MNFTDRQKEIIVNYLLSIKGETKSIPRNFVVMREEVDEIINLLKGV